MVVGHFNEVTGVRYYAAAPDLSIGDCVGWLDLPLRRNAWTETLRTITVTHINRNRSLHTDHLK